MQSVAHQIVIHRDREIKARTGTRQNVGRTRPDLTDCLYIFKACRVGSFAGWLGWLDYLLVAAAANGYCYHSGCPARAFILGRPKITKAHYVCVSDPHATFHLPRCKRWDARDRRRRGVCVTAFRMQQLNRSKRIFLRTRPPEEQEEAHVLGKSSSDARCV